MSGTLTGVNRLVPGLIEQVQGKQSGEQTSPTTKENQFAELLSNLLESVNDMHQQAAQAQGALMAGEPVELHQVMIKAEEAGVATDLLLEIRNKLITAYNELMRMPM